MLDDNILVAQPNLQKYLELSLIGYEESLTSLSVILKESVKLVVNVCNTNTLDSLDFQCSR